MLGPGVGLVELVEAAGRRVLADDAIGRWHVEACAWDIDSADECQAVAAAIVNETCRLVLAGDFHWAGKVALPFDIYHPQQVWDSITLLDQCPAWQAFPVTVEFAGRIDSYLAVMESDARTAPLAADCRKQLDLLGVLADLCEDAGLPHAAAEARHLRALAESIWRE